MVNLCNVDGRISHESEAVIPVMDRGFLFGDSVYEVFVAREGVPFAWRAHIDRLWRSAAGLGIAIDLDEAELMRRVQDTVRRSLEELEPGEDPTRYIRLIVTRGTATAPSIDLSTATGACHVVVMVRAAPPDSFGKVSTLWTVHKPEVGEAKDPRIKSGNYVSHVAALAEARAKGASECLFINDEGNATEASTANAWFVIDGEIVTAPIEDGLLPGVTRLLLLEALGHAGLPVQERSIPAAEVARAEECFLTGTLRDIGPVEQIDERRLGGWPVTERIVAIWRDYCSQLVERDRTTLEQLLGD